MRKVLMVATVPSMIGMFNMNNILTLKKLGYEVHVACDWTDRSVWTDEKVDDLEKKLKKLSVRYHQISFSRATLKINKHFQSYEQTICLLRKNEYDFVHCHTPIASVITRIACKKMGVKVIYTAHGFHFYKGAPIQNWLFYYPIEKVLSRYTDVLITINQEDYVRAKLKFDMKEIMFVPGVGVKNNVKKISKQEVMLKKKSLGIAENDLVLISVGELSKRKNHELVIRALGSININFKYLIVGKGTLELSLKNLSRKLNIIENIILTGFRTDVIELMQISDIFVFPSLQEGLPVALMEAMTVGLPVVCSDIRGNIDLIEEGVGGYLFNLKEKKSFEKKFNRLIMQNYKSMGELNKKTIIEYTIDEINSKMLDIYTSMMKDVSIY